MKLNQRQKCASERSTGSVRVIAQIHMNTKSYKSETCLWFLPHSEELDYSPLSRGGPAPPEQQGAPTLTLLKQLKKSSS